jgi:C-terminal processing protease CtpA/Prc
VHEPLGISLMQRGSQVVVSSVEPASMAAVQRVRVGSVLDAVNGQPVGNMEVNTVVDMIQAAARPWRLLLRVSPPPMKQNSASPLSTQESSALSAASSVARHYRPLDDDMEMAQDGL